MERMVPGDPKVEPHFLRKIYVEHVNRYHVASTYVTGKQVLDLGCGVGYGSAFLADRGAREVIAIDRSLEAVEHASQHYQRRQVHFSVQEATPLPYSRSSFDVVVCLELIEHVSDFHAVMGEIRRVLKPSGLLIISTPRFRGQLRSEFHVREFLFEDFHDLVQKYFKHCRVYLQNPCFISLIEPLSGSNGLGDLRTIRLAKSDTSTADTFVILASQRRLPSREPTFVTLTDDEYIAYLERERQILIKDWEEKEILLRDLRERLASLEAVLSSKEQETNSLKMHLREAEGRMEVLNTATQTAHQDFLRTQQENQSLKYLLNERAEQLAEGEKELSTARKKIKESVSQHRIADQKLQEAERQITELQTRVAQQDGAFLNLQKEKEQDYSELKKRYYTEMSEILLALQAVPINTVER